MVLKGCLRLGNEKGMAKSRLRKAKTTDGLGKCKSDQAEFTSTYIRLLRDIKARFSHKAAVTQSRTQDGVSKEDVGMTANRTRS
jgi:hypothetical protein